MRSMLRLKISMKPDRSVERLVRLWVHLQKLYLTKVTMMHCLIFVLHLALLFNQLMSRSKNQVSLFNNNNNIFMCCEYAYSIFCFLFFCGCTLHFSNTVQSEGSESLMSTPKNLHAQMKQELSKLIKVLQLPVRIS